jgi:hypothetical protein
MKGMMDNLLIQSFACLKHLSHEVVWLVLPPIRAGCSNEILFEILWKVQALDQYRHLSFLAFL